MMEVHFREKQIVLHTGVKSLFKDEGRSFGFAQKKIDLVGQLNLFQRLKPSRTETKPNFFQKASRIEPTRAGKFFF